MNQETINIVLALCAIAQVVFAIVIVCVTSWYAALTRRLVELQIHPELKLELPDDLVRGENGYGFIYNYSGCDVKNVEIRVGIPYERMKERSSIVAKCVDVISLPHGLRPNSRAEFSCSKYFQHAEVAAGITETAEDERSLQSTVMFDISCRRGADLKPFYFTEHYRVRLAQNGEAKVIRVLQKVRDSLDSHILERHAAS